MFLKEGISGDSTTDSESGSSLDPTQYTKCESIGSIPSWLECPKSRPIQSDTIVDFTPAPQKFTTGEWSNNKDSNNMTVEPPPLAQRTQHYTQGALLEGNIYDFNKGCWIYMPKPCLRKNLNDPKGNPWPGAWAPNHYMVGKPTDSSNPNPGVWLHDTWNTRGTKAYTKTTCKARSLAFNPDSTWCTESTRQGHDQVSYHFAAPEACAPGQKCATAASSTQWLPPPPPPPKCDTYWKKCADENGTCTFDGTKDILYKRSDGQEPNKFKLFKSKTSSVGCNNNIDGDPAYGYGKSCYYCPAPVPIPTAPASTVTKWTACANQWWSTNQAISLGFAAADHVGGVGDAACKADFGTNSKYIGNNSTSDKNSGTSVDCGKPEVGGKWWTRKYECTT